MVVGLIISLFQTLTSIQEQTLTFVPKLIAILIGLMVMGTLATQRDSCFYEYLMGQLQSVYIVKVLFFKFKNGKVVKQ